ncbi:MAG: hypothetical protein ABIF77_19390 [bacterium]
MNRQTFFSILAPTFLLSSYASRHTASSYPGEVGMFRMSIQQHQWLILIGMLTSQLGLAGCDTGPRSPGEREVLELLFEDVNGTMEQTRDPWGFGEAGKPVSALIWESDPGDAGGLALAGECASVVVASLDYVEAGLSHRLYLTATNSRDGSNSCHACCPLIGLALFRDAGDGYLPVLLDREFTCWGSWGEFNSDVAIRRIGASAHAVEVSITDGNQGWLGTWTEFWFLGEESAVSVLAVLAWSDNMGCTMAGDEYEACLTSIEFEPGDDPDFWDAVATQICQTGIVDSTRTVHADTVVTRYVFVSEDYAEE